MVTPLFFTGAIPVLVDVGPGGNIDPNHLESHITPRTKAIMITHMWGYPCEMNAILALVQKHKVLLFENERTQ